MDVTVYFLGIDGVVAPVWVVLYDVYCFSNKVVGREV